MFPNRVLEYCKTYLWLILESLISLIKILKKIIVNLNSLHTVEVNLERSLSLSPIHDEINKINLNTYKIASCIGPLDVIIQFISITVAETGYRDVRFYFS